MKYSFIPSMLVCIFGMASSTSTAKAQTPAQIAESLFNKGLAAMEKENYAEACPAFRDSQKAEPQLGTLFHLATCEAAAKQYASAVSHFEEYLRLYRGLSLEKKQQQLRYQDRPGIAENQIKALSPLRAVLTVSFATPAPTGTTITLDNGDPSSSLRVESPLYVDPGKHVFMTKTPDGAEKCTEITVQQGEKRAVVLEVPKSLEMSTPATNQEQLQNGQLTMTRTSLPPITTETGRPGMKVAAYVIGGIGIAGMGFGAITGTLVGTNASIVKSHCPGGACDEVGFAAYQNAKRYGLMSPIGFSIGMVGIATGVVLLVVSRPKTKSTGFNWNLGPIESRGVFGSLEARW